MRWPIHHVRRVNAYPWSSYSGYIDARHVQEFVTYEVLKEHGRDAAEGRRQYRAYTESCVLENDEPMLAQRPCKRHFCSFPRSAWEPADWCSAPASDDMAAERPQRRSHTERGNECVERGKGCGQIRTNRTT